MPTLDKAQLSARNLDFLCVPRERVVEIVTTSGTAGRPLVWMLTERDLQRLALNEKLSFTCVGLTARDTVLLAVTMDRAFMAGLAYWLGLRELGCGIVRVGPSSPALVLEMIQRTQPSAIVAVPSFLRIVAEKAHETGFDLANAGVKKLICIGEPIRDVSLAPNATGRLIEQAWGARAYSTYGVTELANSLCECDAGAGGHLHEEMLYVEILDDEGRPVPDGEVGEVVATTFGVEAMPLIRYRTGDCAAMFRESCRCGRTSLRVGPIVGRKHQKLKVKGVSLFPSALQAALEDTDGVDSFVIVARSEGGLSDTVEVLVNGPAALSTVRDVLRGRTRIVPSVRQASREEIEALQLPANTRKRRFFVDLR
ncbi:MAG TPA: AMP-binding protein [Verrucomicrobiae bacterium]|nr:AMP-binding protein [Verrucomicrobiae bacterium]